MLVDTCTPAKDSDRRTSIDSPDDVMASPEAGGAEVGSPQATLISRTPPTDAREFMPIARTESSDTWADAETFFVDDHDEGEEVEEEESTAQEATGLLSPTMGLLSPPELSRIASAVASPHPPKSPHQGRLRRAFVAADVYDSGALSKRQLYMALAGAGLVMTPSEQLLIWRMFDRDADGKIAWDEFHRLGAALLLTCPPSTRKAQLTPRGGFAHRAAADEQRLHRAATRIQGIARKRSVERLP